MRRVSSLEVHSRSETLQDTVKTEITGQTEVGTSNYVVGTATRSHGVTSALLSRRRSLSLPGLGRVEVVAVDRHPVLLWLAVGGLFFAAVLAVVGMPPVSIHAPTHGWGIMSPTCGLTRGVAAAARGDVATAWAYNPASLLLVAGAVATVVRALMGSVTGRWVNVQLAITRWGGVVATMVLVILEINQQSHAALLMAG